jgi:hypothetical protein
MRNLDIPPALKVEFATVEAVWYSGAETRRVDALLLSWVKYEKQLRRLFSFFVFQHPKITADKIDSIISAFAANRNLKPETFISGIKSLGLTPLPKLLGDSHTKLWPEITRIKKYRNKIMHGQHTGQGITSSQLEQDVIILINWISSLAQAAHDAYGYDGVKRNTYVAAKQRATLSVEKYPFSTPAELKNWLATLKP